MYRLIFLLSGLAICQSACQKAPQSIKDMERYCEKLRSQQKAASLAVAVVRGEEAIWSAGFGTANRSSGWAADANTPYLLASVSKVVTGIALMQQVEAGNINLDTDINQYLPFAVSHPEHGGTPITCRQLLSHTSSISDEHYDQIGDQFYYYDQDPTLSLRDFCEGVLASGGQFYSDQSFLDGAPGSQYAYSNLGIALLGYIVESVSGQPFDEYCKQRIFQPLQMNRTSWRLSDFDPNKTALPYPADGQNPRHYTFADYPNGGLRSSADDMARLLSMFLGNGSWQGQQILTPASVAAMFQIHYPNVQGAEDQGLILYYQNYKGRRTLGHSGGETGVATEWYFDPETRAGALLFWNEETVPQAKSDQLLEYLLQLAED